MKPTSSAARQANRCNNPWILKYIQNMPDRCQRIASWIYDDLWWFMSIVSKHFGGEMLYEYFISDCNPWDEVDVLISQNDVAVCFQDVTSIIFRFCIKFYHGIIVSVSNSQLFVNSSICKQHVCVLFGRSSLTFQHRPDLAGCQAYLRPAGVGDWCLRSTSGSRWGCGSCCYVVLRV